MFSRHPLAGRTIARMNGAGNVILVLDLRGSPARPTAEDAVAIHRAPGLSYDQMMVLGDPKTEGTAADVLIYNNDGTLAGACGNGTRCVADRLCRELGVDAISIETEAGVIACERLGPWSYRVDMGAPRLDWDAIPLQHAVPDTRRVELWPDGEAPAGAGPRLDGQYGQPARGVLCPGPEPHRRRGPWPEDRGRSDVPGEGQCHLRPDLGSRRREGAGVGAGRWADPRLRLGRLRDPGRGGAAWPSWSAKERCVCRAAT